MSDFANKLTKGSLLAKNTLYSLIGYAIPIFVAIFSIPILIDSLGVDGFGILSIAWMITGYFSLLDFGVGRALTKLISEKLGTESTQGISSLVWSALFLTLIIGLIGSLLLCLIAPFLVNDVFKIPPTLLSDVEFSFYILAISIPIVISTVALRGILESYQRFDIINMIRIPMGSLTFLGPIFVTTFSNQLSHIVSALVIARLIECFLNLYFCNQIIANLFKDIAFKISNIKKILNLGGWIAISNIIGSLLVYLDRFLIGSIISIGAVSYYAVSLELIQRIMLIPGAIVGVLFPALGAVILSNPERAISLFIGGVKYTFLCVFPIILIIFIFAQEGLAIWIDYEFSLKGSTALKLLVIGAMIKSISYFPFAVLHAAGRPDLTAKLNLIETPIYAFIAWVLITNYGIEGAAIAWLILAIFDTSILFLITGKVLNIKLLSPKIILNIFIIILLILAANQLAGSLFIKLIYCLTSLLLFMVYAWFNVLNSDEKTFLKSWLS